MTQIIILAAGKGSRMGLELPKVLVPLNGKPIIYYLMESLKKAEPELKPIVVVSPSNKEIISKALANYDVEYAIQDQQLGTGHAVACARDLVGAEAKNILVLYGDHPFLKTDSIKAFLKLEPEALTIMPTVLPNFEDWYHNFYAWGRIVRNQAGEVKAIVELKDANEEEKLITEVNPGFMCFNKKWLFENIDKLQDNNKAHEFYLTDMVKIAFSQNYKVNTFSIEPQEAMGINSPEELKIAEGISATA
ncbi:NTP transferase domain-containing protein [Patescibacteria group bacterium]|nr:NTP transferase domain-containing protein [Patescibacteria group bacterium]